jgi:hypothetical protein
VASKSWPAAGRRSRVSSATGALLEKKNIIEADAIVAQKPHALRWYYALILQFTDKIVSADAGLLVAA